MEVRTLTRRSKAKRPPYLRPGFTLAEVLIVVAMIAVLVAVMIPVGRGIMKKAGTTTTISNIRQVYGLFGSYAEDHTGTLPAPRDGEIYWSKDRLYGYLDPSNKNKSWGPLENSIFTSPNAPKIGRRDNPESPVIGRASNQGFGMNTHLPESTQPQGGWGEAREARNLLIQHPARTMLLMDSNAVVLFGEGFFVHQFTTYVENRHDKANVVLFCDGRVEVIPHSRFTSSGPDKLMPWNASPGTSASMFWRGR